MSRAHTRSLYLWSGGLPFRSGTVTDAHLRAWEYEPSRELAWSGPGERVQLWRTRRPDLAPPELWVGDQEWIAET
jgi:hypothetical protein